MSTITTSAFNSDLIPIVADWFGDSYARIPTLYDKIMKVEKALDRNYQVDALVQSFGLLQTKNEGSPLQMDFSTQGFTPTYQHIAYALGFQITLEMMEDGEAFSNAKRFTEMLALSAHTTIETLAANVYNNSFSGTTMVGGDGQTLVSSSHPVVAGTQSNLITGGSVDISEAALEQITIDIKNMKNARGIRIGLQPDKLVCSVTDEPTANRILGSPLRSGSADNDLNYLRTNNLIPGGIVANPFLTASHAFWVTTTAPDGVKLLMRKEPEMDSSNDFLTKSGQHSVLMRLSTGWSDWRGVIGSNGP